MPEHVEAVPTAPIRGRHLPGLDGIRAIAVLAVVGFHMGLRPLRGGFLGVDIFFVLSGFLITSLLVEERLATSRTRWIAFWGRRAKRLLPALFAMLICVSLFQLVVGRFQILGGVTNNLAEMRAIGLGSIFYVANWVVIHWLTQFPLGEHGFSPLTPFTHTWSLSVEEQFYWVWPAVVVALLVGARSSWRRFGPVITVIGALASSAYMAVLVADGHETTAYYSTFSRSFDLLVGATLALLVCGARALPAWLDRSLAIVAWPAAGLLATVIVFGGSRHYITNQRMFDGGYLLCAIAAAILIAAISLRPTSLMARITSVRPLVAVGLVSYGIYLWQIPVLMLFRPPHAVQGLWVNLIQALLIAALALVSYFLLEMPVRRHHFTRGQALVVLPIAFTVTCAVVIAGTSVPLVLPVTTEQVSVTPSRPSHPGGEVPGAGGFAGQVPITIPGPIDPAHRVRIGFVGDPFVAQAFPGIAGALLATDEVSPQLLSVPGWSLAGSSAALLYPVELLRLQRAPQLWIFGFDGDAEYASAHSARYADDVRSLVTFLTSGTDPADGVIMMTPPPRQGASPALRLAEARWAATVRSVANEMPGKLMLWPIGASVATRSNHFATWLPPGSQPHAPESTWVRVRDTRDAGICQNGSARMASAILADVQSLFGVGPVRHAWWHGGWVHADGFNITASGATCPPDHPPG